MVEPGAHVAKVWPAMPRRGRAALLLALAAGLLAWPGVAHAGATAPAPPVKVFSGADISRAGQVDLTVFAPDGSVAVYYERIGSRRVRLGTRVTHGPDLARLSRATTWRCDRLTRRFEVDATGRDGTRYSGAYAVRTPSCRYRFELTVPRRVRRGQRVTIGVRDSWRIGGARPRLCVAAPRARARCRVAALQPAQSRGRYRFRATRTGTWKVRLRVGSAGPSRLLAVGNRRAAPLPALAPRVLATGDSTMQGVDGFLAERLGRSARLTSRIRPATGIAKPGRPSWLRASRIQSSSLKPAGTVVSIGVNDGYPMLTPDGRRVACCGGPWVTEYARRVRIMMRTWSRFGGHVAWMTLPPTGVAHLAPRLTAVNAAILQAAAGLPRVSVVRVDRLLSRSGRHEPTRVIGGRRVRMYLSDSLHLSPAGTAIAARAVATALRKSGAVASTR